MAVRRLRRRSGPGAGEPLAPEDWEVAVARRSPGSVGEAFVGNIGHRALYDFTAVGEPPGRSSSQSGLPPVWPRRSGPASVCNSRASANPRSPTA